jgi:hypothetical protein
MMNEVKITMLVDWSKVSGRQHPSRIGELNKAVGYW